MLLISINMDDPLVVMLVAEVVCTVYVRRAEKKKNKYNNNKWMVIHSYR